MAEKKKSLQEVMEEEGARERERMRNDPEFAKAVRATKKELHERLMAGLASSDREEKELTGGSTELFPVLLEVRDETGLDIDTLARRGCGTFRKLVQAILRKRRIRDTKSDTPEKGKKKSKPRKMNIAASDCCRRFKAAKGVFPMKTIVEEYVTETKNGTFNSIMRVLNDNPEHWKDDTKTT